MQARRQARVARNRVVPPRPAPGPGRSLPTRLHQAAQGCRRRALSGGPGRPRQAGPRPEGLRRALPPAPGAPRGGVLGVPPIRQTRPGAQPVRPALGAAPGWGKASDGDLDALRTARVPGRGPGRPLRRGGHSSPLEPRAPQERFGSLGATLPPPSLTGRSRPRTVFFVPGPVDPITTRSAALSRPGADLAWSPSAQRQTGSGLRRPPGATGWRRSPLGRGAGSRSPRSQSSQDRVGHSVPTFPGLDRWRAAGARHARRHPRRPGHRTAVRPLRPRRPAPEGCRHGRPGSVGAPLAAQAGPLPGATPLRGRAGPAGAPRHRTWAWRRSGSSPRSSQVPLGGPLPA